MNMISKPQVWAAAVLWMCLALSGWSQPVESGSYKFFVGKEQVGSERYRIEPAEHGGFVLSGDNEIKPGSAVSKQRFQLRFGSQLEWRGTQIEVEGAGDRQAVELTVVGDKLRIRTSIGKGSPIEQEQPRTPDLVLWSSNIFTPFAVLARRYDAKRGGSQQLGAMLPNVPVELERQGTTEVKLGGKVETLTKFVAVIGKRQETTFWVDERGVLVKLVLPSQKFALIRDGAEEIAGKLDFAANREVAAAHSQPPGVRAEEVKFSGAGVKLAGTLRLPKPEAGQRAPAVLILVGSGPTPRDGAHYTYRDIAEHLAAHGIAVLSFDKRCIGASECKPKSSWEDYIRDAQAAIVYLRQRAEIDPARVAVFGHSEGGQVAATLASQDTKLSAVVLAAAAGRPFREVLREQVRNRLTEAGQPEGETRAYLTKLDGVLDGIEAGKTDFREEKIDPHDTLLNALSGQPEFVIGWLKSDPLQVVGSIRSPVLIVQGEKDIQVSVRDARNLEEALQRANHPDHTLRLLPDVDHLLKTNAGAATLRSYEDSSRPVDAALLKVLASWLRTKLRAGGEPGAVPGPER